MKLGILLLNLGTPDEPTPEAVGRYLKQFLMDPYVIDIPVALRWMLVNIAIVPRRKYKSAEAYKTIWQRDGSPLAIYLRDLVQELQKIRPDAHVAGAMRYGNPSIEATLLELKNRGLEELVLIPLYPQYAESSTQSSLDEVFGALKRINWNPKLRMLQSFFDDREHAAAWADLISVEMGSFGDNAPHLLLSYHGLPERHLVKAEKRSNPTGNHCLDGGKPNRAESEKRTYACCEKAIATSCKALSTCYRAQCLRTSQMIVKELRSRGHKISEESWSMSFQSRLGRTPWIKPYTDDVIPELVKKNVTRLLVATPSFVADCLETIEEIGDRAKHDFLHVGGNEFRRVPCLNTSPKWIETLSQLVDKAP